MTGNAQYTGPSPEGQGTPGKRVFRPALVPTLVTVALVPVLLGFGIWQLQRAEEKRELYAAFERDDAVSLAAVADSGLEQMRYRRADVYGSYDGEHQFLLDNMTHRGKSGYHVITPLLPETAAVAVLVNRGWVPLGETRERLPQVGAPVAPRLIRGRVDGLPRPGLRLSPPPHARSAPWPRLMQFPVFDELEQALGYELAPFLLLLDPGESDGYVRDWQPRSFGPERHVAYAVQWFALALTLLIIYVAVNFRRQKPQ